MTWKILWRGMYRGLQFGTGLIALWYGSLQFPIVDDMEGCVRVSLLFVGGLFCVVGAMFPSKKGE